jgi:hypothetical protein
MEKNCCNPQCFQEKNYKVKFSTNYKDNFEKNHNKQNERKKKQCWETL